MLIDWDGDGEIDELDWILTDMVLFDDEHDIGDADKKSPPKVKRNAGCLTAVLAAVGIIVTAIILTIA